MVLTAVVSCMWFNFLVALSVIIPERREGSDIKKFRFCEKGLTVDEKRATSRVDND